MRFDRRRSFGRPRRFNAPKPVKAGEEYDVEINEVGAKGDGIARVNNFVVFVPDTKKGDKVRIRINEVRNRFATGEKIATEKTETKKETKAEETEIAEEPTTELTKEEATVAEESEAEENETEAAEEGEAETKSEDEE